MIRQHPRNAICNFSRQTRNGYLTKPMNSKLQKAIEQGNLPAVEEALDRGAELEAADMHGTPGLPLRTACFRGHAAIVAALLQRGANINAANADGAGAPMRMAARGKNWHVVDLLLKHGAAPLPDIEVPRAQHGERRKRRERRSNNYGPPPA